MSPEGIGTWKHRVLTLNSWGAYRRNDFSEHRLLNTQRSAKFLNLTYLVSLMVMFWTTCPLFQKLLISWLLPLTSAMVSEPSETLSPRSQSSFCPEWNLTCNSHIVHFFKSTGILFKSPVVSSLLRELDLMNRFSWAGKQVVVPKL